MMDLPIPGAWMSIRGMKRRAFIAVLGGALAWSFTAQAQQRPTKTPRIGIIDDAPIWDHFRRGLRELGYIDGQNIAIEYRSAEGQSDRLAAVASDLASLSVDVIVTSGSAAARAAQQATTTIPIVMIAIGDPVGAGLVRSLARPGGNITGNTILGTEMNAKRMQLLKQFIPGALRVAFLWNPNNASHLAYLAEWREVAPKLGVEPLFVEVGSFDQFEPAFASMLRERSDALSVTADPFHLSHIGWIIDFVAKNRLPTMYVAKENAAAGGLLSYGPSLPDLYRRAAGYVHKILQGTKPADLPVGQPVEFELVINLKTATTLGLTVPQTLLYTADEVIE
jgi:putative tryptophan/tyrosine transport system substrate-binding protein